MPNGVARSHFDFGVRVQENEFSSVIPAFFVSTTLAGESALMSEMVS